MTLATAAIIWIGLGLAGLGLHACAYGRPPLWLTLLTIVVGPAAFGSGAAVAAVKLLEWGLSNDHG
jgi:hypothetical protein